MDRKLAAWARQVKARNRAQAGPEHGTQGKARAGTQGPARGRMGGHPTIPSAASQAPHAAPPRAVPKVDMPRLDMPRLNMPRLNIPVLWLFTDLARLPDPVPAILRLPRGCGVVFRHDGAPGRAALAAQVARACRARGAALTVAGDPRLAAAVGAGLHLRGGRPGRPCPPGWIRPGRVTTSSAHGPADLRRAAAAGAAAFLSPLFPTRSHPGAPALGPVRWAALARGAGCAVLALGGVNGAAVRAVPPGARGAGLVGGWTGRQPSGPAGAHSGAQSSAQSSAQPSAAHPAGPGGPVPEPASAAL